MDPNTALDNLRAVVAQLQAYLDSDGGIDVYADVYAITEHASEVVDTFNGLDQWITNGGFLPKDWSR